MWMKTLAAVCPEGASVSMGRLKYHTNFCTISKATYLICSLPCPYGTLLFPF